MNLEQLNKEIKLFGVILYYDERNKKVTSKGTTTTYYQRQLIQRKVLNAIPDDHIFDDQIKVLY